MRRLTQKKYDDASQLQLEVRSSNAWNSYRSDWSHTHYIFFTHSLPHLPSLFPFPTRIPTNNNLNNFFKKKNRHGHPGQQIAPSHGRFSPILIHNIAHVSFHFFFSTFNFSNYLCFRWLFSFVFPILYIPSSASPTTQNHSPWFLFPIQFSLHFPLYPSEKSFQVSISRRSW